MKCHVPDLWEISGFILDVRRRGLCDSRSLFFVYKSNGLTSKQVEQKSERLKIWKLIYSDRNTKM